MCLFSSLTLAFLLAYVSFTLHICTIIKTCQNTQNTHLSSDHFACFPSYFITPRTPLTYKSSAHYQSHSADTKKTFTSSLLSSDTSILIVHPVNASLEAINCTHCSQIQHIYFSISFCYYHYVSHCNSVAISSLLYCLFKLCTATSFHNLNPLTI